MVVSGKGGVGKTTISAALAFAAVERGLRTIVVELGDQRRLPELLAGAPADPEPPTDTDLEPNPNPNPDPDPDRSGDETRAREGSETGEEIALAENLWSVTIDQDRALLEWLQALGGRVPGRVLASSGTFQYFAAASPGARELVAMVKVWELTRSERWRRRAQRYDLVILDAPATGHALGLLHAPCTFGAIARVGPIFSQAEQVRELLCDPRQSAYVAVAHPTEMAVSETLDLRAGLRSRLARDLDATIVNAVLPRRFHAGELERLEQVESAYAARADARDAQAVAMVRSARRAAQSMHERARIQHNHIGRLRRSGLAVHTVPLEFMPALDRKAISSIARRLARWV